MPLVILTYDLEDGVDTAYGSQVIQNFNDVLAVVNGGLADDNFSGSAKIKGTRISDVVGERIPTTRLEDDAVDATKLKDAAADVNDAQRAVTTDHIRLLSVNASKIAATTITKDKLTVTAGQRIAYPQLELLVESVAFSFNFPGGDTGNALASASIYRETTGPNYNARLLFESNDPGNFAGGIVAPVTAVPVATRLMLGLYLANVTYVFPGFPNKATGSVVFVSLAIN